MYLLQWRRPTWQGVHGSILPRIKTMNLEIRVDPMIYFKCIFHPIGDSWLWSVDVYKCPTAEFFQTDFYRFDTWLVNYFGKIHLHTGLPRLRWGSVDIPSDFPVDKGLSLTQTPTFFLKTLDLLAKHSHTSLCTALVVLFKQLRTEIDWACLREMSDNNHLRYHQRSKTDYINNSLERVTAVRWIWCISHQTMSQNHYHHNNPSNFINFPVPSSKGGAVELMLCWC